MSDISIKPGKRKSSQARSEEVREGEQWMSQGYPPGVVACGPEQPIACHQAGACDIGQGEAAGGKKHLPSDSASHPFLSWFILFSHHLCPWKKVSLGVPFAGAIPKPTGFTWRGWHPGLMLRGRNSLTDTPLFIQAINNSHKNPLLSLLCSAKPCQWERRRHLFYGRLEAGFAFFWLT